MVMRFRRPAALLFATSWAALSSPAFAQTVSPDAANTAEEAADTGRTDIVVTGTRIQTRGFEAPTPVTASTTEELRKANPVDLSEALVQLPQFANTITQSNRSANAFAGPVGTFLNLRGLGPARTLNLIDGLRIPPNTFQGTTSVDVIPQALIKRVDIVTGGASAAYGSDAVSGVVNFILDNRFEGYKVSAQSGISDRGDNFNYRVSAAGGWKLGDRGHLIVAFERSKVDGLQRGDREYGSKSEAFVGQNPGAGIAGSAANPLVLRNNVYNLINTVGGLVSSGPFANTYFPSPGVFRPVVTGTATGSGAAFIGPSDYYTFPGFTDAVNDTRLQTAYARASYELTDAVNIFVRGTLAGSRDSGGTISESLLGRNPPLTIYSGNAYLPTALQAQLNATGTSSFNLVRALREFGTIDSTQNVFHYNVVAGADGALFDNRVKWNLAYSRGWTRTRTSSSSDIEYRRFYAAVDAVRDSTGNIVCRVTLTNPGLYPGCVPLNLFGEGSASPEAVAWIQQNPATYTAVNTYDSVAGSFSGDLFQLPAGPVGFAAGAEWRRETLKASGNADPAVTLPITGLRGLTESFARYRLSNTGTTNGSIDVKEFFAEVNVPIFRDRPLFHSLEFNGAIRYTDYGTIGGATTWKAGGRWAPLDGLTFRATRLRDIRAPNLYELFRGGTQGLIGGVNDIHTNTTPSARTQGGGNPNLQPEVGDTLSLGVVAQPRFLPGFDASIDYYDIGIKGAIASLSADTMIQLCELSNGTAAVCDNIVRPLPFSDRSANNAPNLIILTDINTASLKQRGIDFEIGYRSKLANGDLRLRAVANYLISNTTRQSKAEAVIQNAGYGLLPKLRGLLTVNYDTSSWGVFVQERLVGKVGRATGATGGTPLQIFVDPKIPAQLYTDLTLTARPSTAMDQVEFFLTVRNAFDKKMPYGGSTVLPFGGLLSSTVNRVLYDWIGRSYNAGVRMKF